MKKIKTLDAVGQVLSHDITQIIPGKIKDAVFRKGHIIKEEDIEVLLSVGKEHIYVWEEIEGYVHENDAAERLKNIIAGKNLSFSEVKEGKINFVAETNGLLKVKFKKLFELNSLGEISCATLRNNYLVSKGMNVAGVRAIPLMIDEKKLLKAEELITEPIVEVRAIKSKKVGIVTTGSEIFKGRIKDAFGPVIRDKVEEFDCEVLGQTIVDDKIDDIKAAIQNWIKQGAELIICTGGMSVDPDDVTPTAIKASGADIISYGSPVLPGSMFLVSYYQKKNKQELPILGLPGCVMYAKRTVFDLILPRVLADDKITMENIAELGHGGLCLSCDECHYPNCSFGKF